MNTTTPADARAVDVDDALRWRDAPAMFTFRVIDGNTLYVVEPA